LKSGEYGIVLYYLGMFLELSPGTIPGIIPGNCSYNSWE
jgi:hypothetical protein